MSALIIHGDARLEVEKLTEDAQRVVVITDPVWPNAPADLKARFGCTEPEELLADVLERTRARRVVVWLGVMSDPRFMRAVPGRWPFLRVCWLRYNVPSRQSTVLVSGDVAYVFGDREYPDGGRVVPGECTSGDATGNETGGAHPCPRKLTHALWLVRWLTKPGDLVLDPFCGSGTTGVAALRLGRDFIGIEQDADFALLARERIAAELEHSTTAARLSGQTALFAGAGE